MGRYLDRLRGRNSGSGEPEAQTRDQSDVSDQRADERVLRSHLSLLSHHEARNNGHERGGAIAEPVDNGGIQPVAEATSFDPDDLRDRYTERAAIRQFDAGYTRAEAELMAWNEVAAVWYRRHGVRVPADRCAGCGKPLVDNADVLLLPHGEWAHAGEGYSCVIAYGEKWKRQAAEALEAMGILPPGG